MQCNCCHTTEWQVPPVPSLACLWGFFDTKSHMLSFQWNLAARNFQTNATANGMFAVVALCKHRAWARYCTPVVSWNQGLLVLGKLFSASPCLLCSPCLPGLKVVCIEGSEALGGLSVNIAYPIRNKAPEKTLLLSSPREGLCPQCCCQAYFQTRSFWLGPRVLSLLQVQTIQVLSQQWILFWYILLSYCTFCYFTASPAILLHISVFCYWTQIYCHLNIVY